MRKRRGSEKWTGGPRERGKNNSMEIVMMEKKCVWYRCWTLLELVKWGICESGVEGK